jgi:outer membrane protein assembly factor BamD (BamD/ComL family)
MRKIFPALIGVVVLSLTPTFSWGFLNFFEKDYENAPNNAELQAQEASAKTKLSEGEALESSGNAGKAINVYKKIVESYPLTTTASLSQYKLGAIYRNEGDFVKAFDAFETFVANYKQSSAFDSAVQAQYDITVAGQNGEFKDSFLGIPRKLQPSELLEMYGKVIKNAPYSNLAPLAQFQIAEVYQKDGKAREAIAAYQKLVDDYPRSSKSPEAQYRIGAIGKDSLEKGSQDPDKVAKAREAWDDLLIQYPNHERAQEARAGISKLNAGDAKKSFEIGRFYEKQKRYHSARIYFNKVLEVPTSEFYAEAQQKLASMPDTGPTPTPDYIAPVEEKSGGLREFKFPSMPKVPKLFGRKGEEDLPEGNFTEGGSTLAEGDIEATNWAEMDKRLRNEMDSDESNTGGTVPEVADQAPEASEDRSTLEKMAFWKKNKSEDTSPEAVEEERSGLSRLAFWKKDKPAAADAPSEDDFAPVDTVRKTTTSSKPIVKVVAEEEEKKKFIRMPKLPSFGKGKSDETEIASTVVKEKALKNQPNYVGPPAPKKSPQTASVPMRITPSATKATAASAEVTGGKPTKKVQEKLIAPPPPEE